jgi:hypothetical protein
MSRPISCVQNFRSFAHSVFSKTTVIIVKYDPKFYSAAAHSTQIGLWIAQKYDFQFTSVYISYNYILNVFKFKVSQLTNVSFYLLDLSGVPLRYLINSNYLLRKCAVSIQYWDKWRVLPLGQPLLNIANHAVN